MLFRRIPKFNRTNNIYAYKWNKIYVLIFLMHKFSFFYYLPMLRTQQLNRLKEFLTNPPLAFKILVLSPQTLHLLSHSYHQSDLRSFGITTLFDITSQRDKIDIPAIYFVEPTQANLRLIVKDILANKYNGYFLNFTTFIPRNDLKALGHALNEHGMANQILSVWDQHVNFVSLRRKLFTYGEDGIFSVFFTLGSVPFIIGKDTKKLMELNKRFKNCSIKRKGGQRPLLILLDREFDVFTPIAHSWSYNSLICDLLGSCDNRVHIDKEVYEIDPENNFFIENESEPFTVVAEKIEQEVIAHKKDMALRNIDEKSDKKKIAEMLEKAPELAKRNECIKTHMAICLKLVEIIKERKIDDFFSLAKSTKLDDLSQVADQGTDQDIIRLAASLREDIANEILKYRNIKSSNALQYISRFKNNTANKNIPLYGQVVSGVLGNIKRLIPTKNEVPLFSEIETIFNCIKAGNFDSYSFIDPEGGATVYEKQINSIFIAIKGGGTFDEYNSIKRLENKLGMPVYYGCDRLMNANGFLGEYENYGKM